LKNSVSCIIEKELWNKKMVVLIFLLQIVCIAFARQVEVDISAHWPQYSSSFSAEVGELLYEQSHTSNEYRRLYWDYLDRLCANSAVSEGHGLNQTAQSALDSQVFDIALQLLPKSLHSLAETALGLGYYAPSVQFYRSITDRYGSPCGEGHAFLVSLSDETISCSLNSETIKSHSSTGSIYPGSLIYAEWNHIYPDSTASNRESPQYFLLGSYGTPSFCSLYGKLKFHSTTGEIQPFGIRPSFHGLPHLQTDTKLQGFGVFLDIKNMEYKNLDSEEKKENENDEEKKKTEQEGGGREEEQWSEEEEIAGINFFRLSQRNPSLPKEEIKILRDSLLSEEGREGGEGGGGGEGETTKVWKMKDFGLQVLQLVSSTATRESPSVAMNRLKELVQNFPRYAPMISSTKVAADLREELTQVSHRLPHLGLPMNALFINSQRFDLGGNTFNLFDLLSTLKEEIDAANHLKSLRFSPAINRLIKAAVLSSDGVGDSSEGDETGGGGGATDPAVALEKEITRIDVSKGGKFVVHFLNNLEKDKQYKNWPKQLTTLLYPSWSLHTVGRNLYSLIINIDPISSSGVALLSQTRSLLEDQLPIRFGVTLFCDSRPGDNEHTVLTRAAVCRLFAKLVVENPQKMSVAATFLEAAGNSFLENQENNNKEGREGGGEDQLTDLSELFVSYSSQMTASNKKSSGNGKKTNITVEEVKDFLVGSSQSLFADYIANSTEYYRERNLPVNSFSLNGILSVEPALSQSLMRLLGREQFLLSSYVRRGLLTDKTKSVFADIMRLTPSVFSRYHPMIDEKDPALVDLSRVGWEGLERMKDGRTAFFTPFLSLAEFDNKNEKDSVSSSSSSSLNSLEASHTLIAVLPTDSRGRQLLKTLFQWIDGTTITTEEENENENENNHDKNNRRGRNTQLTVIWRSSIEMKKENSRSLFFSLFEKVKEIFLNESREILPGLCDRLCFDSLSQLIRLEEEEDHENQSNEQLVDSLISFWNRLSEREFSGYTRQRLIERIRESASAVKQEQEQEWYRLIDSHR
jgi:hypothetical protein